MKNENKISGSMFGYNKSEVNNYINGLIEKYKKEIISKGNEINDKNKEIEKLKDENKSLSDKISKLEKEIESLNGQKDIVALAIIKAETEAAKIMEAANSAAESRAFEIEQQLKKEKQKVEAVKTEIIELQKSAIRTIRNFEAQMSLLSGTKVEE